MTALHLMVMERTVVMEKTVVTGESSGGENGSEGNDNGRDDQSRDDNGDDGDEESQHSGLGACSTPSSQKADASTEEQTSQAEEPPRKRTEKTGNPTLPTTCQRSKQEKGEDAPP